MSNSLANRFINRLFRRVAGVVWDVSTGQIGLRDSQDNIHTISGFPTAEAPDSEPQVVTNPFGQMGFSVPALATQVAIADVALGDLILSDQKIQGWVIGKTPKSLKVMDHHGNSRNYTPPKVTVMGGVPDGVLVVQSLFSLTGGATQANGFAANLLPLMLLNGNDKDLSDMLPLLLMGGGLGAAAPAAAAGTAAPAAGLAGMFSNPVLMMMLMDKGGSSSGRGSSGSGFDMKTLMLMQALGGGANLGSMNPLLLMSLMGGKDIFGSFLDTTTSTAGNTTTRPALRPA
jgi:hypothetical protein